jgi:hypothetical protein
MSLQESLDQIRIKARSRMPEETKEIMRNATKLLIASKQVDKALGLGRVAPDFTLQDPAGVSWDTQTLRAKGPYLLVFIRGHW